MLIQFGNSILYFDHLMWKFGRWNLVKLDCSRDTSPWSVYSWVRAYCTLLYISQVRVADLYNVLSGKPNTSLRIVKRSSSHFFLWGRDNKHDPYHIKEIIKMENTHTFPLHLQGKHSANPVLQMSRSILWKLWRLSEILVEVWRNCWSLSETVGDESKSSLFPWVLLGGSRPEVSTGHCHTRGCVPGNSSSTFGNLHRLPCSTPSWCRWWLRPRLHRHFHRRDSSSGRWLSDVRCSRWDCCPANSVHQRSWGAEPKWVWHFDTL